MPLGKKKIFLKDKSEIKSHKVSKFDLGLLNAYKQMYFDKNMNGNKDGKILKGNLLLQFFNLVNLIHF